MKRADIKPCAVCGKGVLHDRQIAPMRVSLQRFVADHRAIEQQAGLEMMLGSPAIAAAMGPDRDLFLPVEENRTVLLCERCAAVTTVFRLYELLNEAEEAVQTGGSHDRHRVD